MIYFTYYYYYLHTIINRKKLLITLSINIIPVSIKKNKN